MRAARAACFMVVAAAGPGAAHAQDYPASPVRFIVPFSAGGGTDLVARVTGRKLAEKWGQSVVIENRPGGDGAIGLEAAARAAPDGHTMVMILTAHAVLPSVKSKVGYNLLQDFAPVMNMVEFPNVLLAHPGVPVANVRELIALARARPGQLNFAGAGIGGHAHLAGELFNSLAGIRMTYISYKGTAPALVELLGGHVDLMFAAMGSVLPHVRSGKLRPLAITSAQRSATLPALPTVDESGLKGYEFVGWYGVGVPAGTPQGLVAKLEAAFRSVLADPEVLKVLGDAGGHVVGSGSGPFGAYMKAELAKYAQVVAKAKIKVD